MSEQPRTETAKVIAREAISEDVQREILRAIGAIQFGSVEVVIHDSRVVQIESREKIRIPDNATRRV